MHKVRTMVFFLTMIATSPLWARPTSPPQPPKPLEQIPDLRTVKSFIACGDCDQPFDTSTHKKVLEDLISNEYIAELRRALYLQDTYHQFESKAHYDNCDFDGANDYIDILWEEVDIHVRAGREAKDKGDEPGLTAAVKKAFFALGQALHGAQDFYAHTNYVELSVDGVKKSTDIPIVTPWKPTGKDRIKKLLGNGLVSGYVFWGFPQKCLSETPSHADLAKDKATTTSGAVKVSHLENRNHYQIAVQLAREASQELIDDAFQRWPLLKEVNGKHVAFEILVDRRGL